MANFVSYSLVAGGVFFSFLGLIFCIVGYFTFWLIPREVYDNNDNKVDGVGLRTACFTNFRFPTIVSSVDINTIFDGCVDNTRRSARFTDLNQDVWSPRWFQVIQDMHLSSIIILVLNMLLISGFIAVYVYNDHRVRHRKRPSAMMSLIRCCLSLWFIITIVMGVVLVAEPLIFYTNYQQSSTEFYYSDKPYNYGPGFIITVVAGLSLIGSAVCGLITFLGIFRKMFSRVLKSEMEMDEAAQHSMGSYSDQGEFHPDPITRAEPDGLDRDEKVTEYTKEPRVASQYYSDEDQYRDEEGTPDRKFSNNRPVPTPRPRQSVSSREVSRAGSVAAEEVASEYAQHNQRPSTPESVRTPSQHSGHHPSNKMANPKEFQYEFQPGVGYVPKSARPVISPAGGLRSATRSPYSPNATPYYNPAGQRSYTGSYTPSDNESVRSDRNRSVSRSSVPGQRYSSPDGGSPQKVVTPKSQTDVKQSRYAAAGW